MSDTEALIAFLRERVEDEATARRGEPDWHDDDCPVRTDIDEDGTCLYCGAHTDATLRLKRDIIDECVSGWYSDDVTAYGLSKKVLQFLALSHREHPGFREEWAPHD